MRGSRGRSPHRFLKNSSGNRGLTCAAVGREITGNRSMNAKILLRWLAIAGLGGYGLYILVVSLSRLDLPDLKSAWFWFFILPFVLIYCGSFIATAYFILRRQYQNLCTLISSIVAMIVFFFLMSLPHRFGLEKQFYDWSKDSSSRVLFVAVPVSFAALIIPFYATGWVYRRVQAFLSKFVSENKKSERAAKPD